MENLTLGTGEGFANKARAQTTGADIQCPYSPIGLLVAHTLQVWIKTTFCLDVGMAHNIADLGLFTAKGAFFTHACPPFVSLPKSMFLLKVAVSKATLSAHSGKAVSGAEECAEFLH